MREIPEDLIIKASGGDMEAFENIYKLTSGFVYSAALRITNSREDAQEAAQDVFIKAHKNLGRFQFRSSFTTWLYRIAVNTAINIYNKNSKEAKKVSDYDTEAKGKEGKEDSSGPLLGQENEQLINSLLGALNPGQRACVILKGVEGLSYKEISDVLGININTVRTRLKRAREAMLARREGKVV